ncbi:hypothetical protein GCM10009740_15730 [Terrabacter terrae]|uniref:RNA polymerase sigma-70 region 4 domain-containing protein n=1 Tax=Terrabacter terrae TaxID=318434 RepID=A0ABN2U309_9MICO
MVEVAEEDAALDVVLDDVLVEESLGRLQANHRDIVRCLYYQRLVVAKTSARLDLPEGSVKSTDAYAVRDLRVALDGWGDEMTTGPTGPTGPTGSTGSTGAAGVAGRARSIRPLSPLPKPGSRAPRTVTGSGRSCR